MLLKNISIFQRHKPVRMFLLLSFDGLDPAHSHSRVKSSSSVASNHLSNRTSALGSQFSVDCNPCVSVEACSLVNRKYNMYIYTWYMIIFLIRWSYVYTYKLYIIYILYYILYIYYIIYIYGSVWKNVARDDGLHNRSHVDSESPNHWTESLLYRALWN